MMDTKYQTENSFFYEEFENDSLVENELEEKLWELYDRRKNQTSKSITDFVKTLMRVKLKD